MPTIFSTLAHSETSDLTATTASSQYTIDSMASKNSGAQYGTVAGRPNEAASSPASPLLDNEAQAEAGDGEQPTFWRRCVAFYERNIGLFFVFMAQMFASIMSMITRLLATGFDVKFHALQIIFVRMFATAIVGTVYMTYKGVPGFPFGPRGVRWLLVLRGTAGSIGLFGLYYALSILDISDATVITFLVPTMTAFVCWVALGEPFTVKEASAGAIAFVGVLFVARPTFIFPSHDDESTASALSVATSDMRNQGDGLLPPERASPAQRAIGIGFALLNAFSAATSYATIRIIGKRAHSLISVNYFAVMASVLSAAILLIHPDLAFKMPQSGMQWALLVLMGVSGFLFQVLITEGLQREKAGRATNLIYVQLVFALIIERVVWGTVPPLESFIGAALIIGSAVWVSLQKNKKGAKEAKTPSTDEEAPLLRDNGNESSSRN